jgi:hypothetical protein
LRSLAILTQILVLGCSSASAPRVEPRELLRLHVSPIGERICRESAVHFRLRLENISSQTLHGCRNFDQKLLINGVGPRWVSTATWCFEKFELMPGYSLEWVYPRQFSHSCKTVIPGTTIPLRTGIPCSGEIRATGAVSVTLYENCERGWCPSDDIPLEDTILSLSNCEN